MTSIRTTLKSSTAVCVLGLALLAAPSFAQTTAPDTAPAGTTADETAEGDAIVVTGSILRRTDAESASPIETLSSETLLQRGITTTSEALQRLSANGAGTIATGWNTGSNFATGATAPALRGLSVQNTLSIVDGLRIAPYPLADDGQRNFVDLNTIPEAIIERIEVLKDGASSTYGADAIAGVVNIITKKQIQGVHLNGSGGISSRGDGGEYRLQATYGYGDLDTQGFNAYISGEYMRSDEIQTRDRGFPFNTNDLTSICNAAGSCLNNTNYNGYNPTSGVLTFTSVPGIALVRPIASATATTASGTTRYTYLNAAAGCRGYESVTYPSSASTIAPSTLCEFNQQSAYRQLTPQIERYGATARVTANLGDRAQIYAMGTYYQTNTLTSAAPNAFNQSVPPPTTLSGTVNINLPVYVCANGVGTFNGLNTGCNAANGTLNPYNPYAAQGLRAQVLYRNLNPTTIESRTRSLRGVVGLDGSFGDDWRYSANFTASEVRFKLLQNNYLIPQRIFDLIARGQFNFADPASNPQSVYDYISPENRTVSTSRLYQGQATLAKDLFTLPGGPLQVAVGIAWRKEEIDNPSANPENLANPYDRYYTVNAVGTAGSRNVKSAFFEINAPIIDQIEIGAAGRYDDYSTGQKNFSPKVTVKLKPIPEVLVRGTFTKGFRIPSFNEAFGLPTTGYVTRQVNCTTYAAFCAAHGNNAYVQNSYSLGLTQTGDPSLDPEKSTSFTGGIVFEPIRNVSFSADFFHIKIKDQIVGVTDTSAAEDAYYSNNGVVDIPGITVLQGAEDPQFPNALPLIGFVQSSYKNAQSSTVSGIDFAINADYPINESLSFASKLDATYLLKYKLTDETGTSFRYDGTLSPCNITSCSGAPKWRATWQNSLTVNDTTFSVTAYYTRGVDTAQLDYGAIKGDCAYNAAEGIIATFPDGSPVQCRTKDIWNVDFSLLQKVGDNLTLYANVLNIFDIAAPFDRNAAYGLFNYNPAFAGPNIVGRYIRIGAKVDF